MCLTIRQALEIVFEVENIQTRDDLDKWCLYEGVRKWGNPNCENFSDKYRRDRLYSEVRTLASEHWNRLYKPEASIRVLYEHILSGYKCHNAEYKSIFK
jgi:tRNA(Ile)-lysidine synthase TilS/MesJ